MNRPSLCAVLLVVSAAVQAADIEISETHDLPECHGINWVREWVKDHTDVIGAGWDHLSDPAKPPATVPAPRNWVWNIPEDCWREAVARKGEGKKEPVKVDLWLPERVESVRGVVAISRHGSGLALFRHADLRQLARELGLAIFMFEGNPVQRGFWPKTWLFGELKRLGNKIGHPELEHAPLFLYGHSSAVGFSALFAADESDRVWGWVAMRPGYTFQVYQPGAATSPGLVIFGEDDKFFANVHMQETLAIVPMMRKHHDAVWNVVVEPKGGHAPGEPTWRLVLSFLRHTFAARVPAQADPRQGPPKLESLSVQSGYLGHNWDAAKGGYQTLSVAPFASFEGDTSIASWLVNEEYAKDWQAFHRTGAIASKAPVRPNTWIKAVTDRRDAVYAVGEKTVFHVSVTGAAQATVKELAWTLTLDGAKVLGTGTLSLHAGGGTVEGTLEQPGVLQLKLVAPEAPETLGIGLAAAAFDPFRIAATAELPADFAEFWTAQKADLAAVPIDAKVARVAQADPGVEVFDISLASVEGLRVHGYLARPKGATSLPAIMSLPGMGDHPGSVERAADAARLGFLALDMGIHDLPNVRSPEDRQRWEKIVSYPYLGREDRQTYYYRRVFLGIVRAIEYLASHPDWNRTTLIATGASQGGGLAIIAAGLDTRVTAVAAIAPALGEHTGPLHGRPDAAPMNLIMGRDKHTPDPRIVAATAYYDTCNFARFVNVPVVMSIGLIDTAVPPTTALSIYNLLTGPKSVDLDPLTGHNLGRGFKTLRDRFYQEQAGIADPSDKVAAPPAIGAPIAAIELSETLSLPECHSIGWVRLNTQPKEQMQWNGELDEVVWGTPSKKQPVLQDWDWKLDEPQWREAVAVHGEGKCEDCTFDLWIPEGIEVVKGVVVMSGHGSGSAMFKNGELRDIARELHLALFTFVGNPVQRGFWPQRLLYERLKAFGERSGHPELEHAPLFLYGHSNGTGFSAIFAATEAARVWGWISMRPGITFQVYQPGAAKVPGMVIFGEDDQFLGRPSKEANLAIVPAMRKRHGALWNFAVEPKTGHGPGVNTWPLVFSFLRHTWAARVPADADPRRGPVALEAIEIEQGHLGHNWDLTRGGYQTLDVAPFATFTGDRSTASWLVNEAFSRDWQAFHAKGSIR